MKSLLLFCVLVFLSCTKSGQPLLASRSEMAAYQAITSLNAANPTVANALAPIDDGSVRCAPYATTIYGDGAFLDVKGTTISGYTRNAYLKFLVGNVGAIQAAKLRIYGNNVENTASIDIAVYGVSNDTWTEAGITWNNAPAASATALSSVSITNEAKYYDLDVTSYVKEQAAGDKIASFVLKNSAEQNKLIKINSRTNVANPPQLLISAEAASYRLPDHVFVVWEENKGYTQIIGSTSAPFINSLVSKGTLFTNAYALYHPSYPNYITWFSGSNQGRTNNECISGAPFNKANLYTALKAAGKSFVWYSEGLPAAGSEICSSGEYREKHNPTTVFSNVPGSASQPLTAMNLTDTATFRNLPNVCVITPNMINNMHDGSVKQGDDWLKAKFSRLIDWCMRNNSVFVVYYDEDNGAQDNRIPVLAVGQNIKAGYKETAKYNHYSFTKMVLNCNNADTTFHSNIAHAASVQRIWKY